MDKLSKIFSDFLNHNSKYYKQAINFKKGKDFEKNLIDIFNDNKIEYIYQPNGSQNFPDFYLPKNKININIECKTSKKGKILWNSGFPHENMILLFSSNISQLNDITFFLGKELINNQKRNEIMNWCKEKRKILKKEFNKFNLPKNWSLYFRPMFNDDCKYFKNNNRKKREQNVIKFLIDNEIS